MTTELLQRAFEAYDQKNFAGSQALCETFLSSNGDDPSALMLAGLIAKQQSRLEQAIQLLERSVRIAPTANALMNLAQCLWRSDRPEQGLPFIRQVTSTCPLIAEAHLLEATLLYGLRRLDESLRSAQLAQTYLPDSPLVEARLGCIMTEMRRYDDAEVHFWNAAHFMPQLAHCRQISFRHGLWHEIDGHRTAAPAANLPALCEARMSSPYDTVIAVFCEAASFYDCGAAFVNALAQNAGSSLLHFHIIDPDEKSAAFIDEVIAVAGLKNAVVTFEHVQFDDGGDFNRRRVLNACVRFLHLPSLLTTYERAIACVGIDFVFDMPLDSLVGSTSHADIGLVQREPPDSPWLDISAGLVVAQPSEPALRYFRAIAQYIRHYWSRGDLAAHLDQTALYCVLRMMERFAGAPRVSWLRPQTGAAVRRTQSATPDPVQAPSTVAERQT